MAISSFSRYATNATASLPSHVTYSNGGCDSAMRSMMTPAAGPLYAVIANSSTKIAQGGKTAAQVPHRNPQSMRCPRLAQVVVLGSHEDLPCPDRPLRGGGRSYLASRRPGGRCRRPGAAAARSAAAGVRHGIRPRGRAPGRGGKEEGRDGPGALAAAPGGHGRRRGDRRAARRPRGDDPRGGGAGECRLHRHGLPRARGPLSFLRRRDRRRRDPEVPLSRGGRAQPEGAAPPVRFPSKTHMKSRSNALLTAALFLGAVPAAHAHPGLEPATGFAAGVAHPFSGWDHLLAMIAVGFWAAQLRAPRLLPAAFLTAMALGALAGHWAGPVPGLEQGVAASVLVLGLLIANQVRGPAGARAAWGGAFAIFHGAAHGAEMPAAAGALAYGCGFVAATAILLAAGLAGGNLCARLEDSGLGRRSRGFGAAGHVGRIQALARSLHRRARSGHNGNRDRGGHCPGARTRRDPGPPHRAPDRSALRCRAGCAPARV